MSAQADLDNQYASKGDVTIGDSYRFEYEGIKVYIQAVYRRFMTVSKASAALNAMVKLMDGYPSLGTKAVTAVLSEEGEGILARIMISRGPPRVTGNVTVSLNGTTPNVPAPASLAAYVFPALSSLFHRC